MHHRHLLPVLAVTSLLPAMSHAAILLYEPFNYGDTDVALNAVNGTATGLDGSTYSTNGTTEYLSAGLTFSNLQTTGGAARLAYDSSEARNATRGLDFSLTSGTLYGSMLYRSGGAANNGVSSLLLTSSASHNDNQAKLDIAGNEYEGSGTAYNLMGVRTYGEGEKATGTQMVGDSSVTYLILWQVTNVGATAGTQTVDAWVLTESQFDSFKLGGLTAAELNAAETGTAADNVLQKVSHIHDGSGGYFSLADTDFLRLFSYRGSGTFDEIRLGSGSLDEVTPVPEPASLAALGLACLLGARRRRR